MRTNSHIMTPHRCKADAKGIETADDFNDLFEDKRVNWRAESSKIRRWQRQYKKQLANDLIVTDYSDDQ